MRRIFARILPNVPEKKLRLQKKAPLSFGRRWVPFLSNFQGFSQAFRDFVKVFRDFAQISTDFCPDFYQIKTFGGALALSAPPPPTPVMQHKIGVL